MTLVSWLGKNQVNARLNSPDGLIIQLVHKNMVYFSRDVGDPQEELDTVNQEIVEVEAVGYPKFLRV